MLAAPELMITNFGLVAALRSGECSLEEKEGADGVDFIMFQHAFNGNVDYLPQKFSIAALASTRSRWVT
jgi:hypothetical protein